MIESSKLDSNSRTITFGMVGGGVGSFVGDVHRKAAAFDGKCKLVAGCFSRDNDNNLITGTSLGINPEHLYKNYEEMAEMEAKSDNPIDFVTIVAPNHLHFAATKAFLERGIHVICEKPFVFTTQEADELLSIANKNDLLICVSYSYSGYPLLKHAREQVKEGKIGDIIMVMGEYPQDWLISDLEKGGQKQAAWRTNPAEAGISNCIGDIGSHIEHTVAFVSGLKIKSLCAKLDIVGDDRSLDTNGSVLLNYTNGATGVYWASQVAIGNDNGLRIRIFGTKGSIDWNQEEPNTIKLSYKEEPTQILNRGHGYLHAKAASHLPSGHTEGYYEAFSDIYSCFANALNKKLSGIPLSEEDLDFPNGEAGLEGVKFINACVESSKSGSLWIEL